MVLAKRVLLLALAALLAVASTTVEAQAECEVCIKVVNDVKTSFKQLAEKKGKKTLAVAENAVEKVCGAKGLNAKDSKLCYFLEPLKKDVARQVSFNKDSLKICKMLEKKNPDFCSMKYPVKATAETDFSKLRVKQLKKILADRNVECIGCVEKDDFINKIKETQHLHEDL